MTAASVPPPSDLLPRVGRGSVTDRTTEALLTAILDRRFDADRLPSEPHLATQLGVSRTTVRAALQALDRLGVISRGRGRVTSLRPHVGRESLMVHRVLGLRSMLESQWGEVEVEQSFVTAAAFSPAAEAALGVSGSEGVVVNRKTYRARGVPLVRFVQEVALTRMDPGVARGLVAGTLEAPASVFEWSRTWSDQEIDHSLVELVPCRAGDDDGLAGGMMTPGTPYLELHETHYGEENTPIAFGREVVSPEVDPLRIVRTR